MNIETTLRTRNGTHGPFTGNAGVSQQLQATMRASANWHALDATQREALQIIAHKIGRILSGDPNYADHWHDIGGYARLIEDELLARKELA